MLIFRLGAAATSLSTRGHNIGSTNNNVRVLDSFPQIFPRTDETGCQCPDTRSLLDILWSCLATILALLCTWISIHQAFHHPQKVPSRKSCSGPTWMMMSMPITLEMMLMFVMRQWLAAWKEARKYKSRSSTKAVPCSEYDSTNRVTVDQHWTTAHGHFLLMGGFVLRKGKEDLGIPSGELFEKLQEDREIEFPSLTKEELDDRSKGDPLSKTLMVLKSLWFIIQYIARGTQGLALTELEIVTLAFCSLTGATYFFWWNKPLDARCRVPVDIKHDSDYYPKFNMRRQKKLRMQTVLPKILQTHYESTQETIRYVINVLDTDRRESKSDYFVVPASFFLTSEDVVDIGCQKSQNEYQPTLEENTKDSRCC